jgi:hypothetical protein
MDETTNETGKQVLSSGQWYDVEFIRRMPDEEHGRWYVEFTTGEGVRTWAGAWESSLRDKPREPQWRAFKSADEVPPLGQIELRRKDGSARYLPLACGSSCVRIHYPEGPIHSHDYAFLFEQFLMRVNGQGEWQPAGVKE